MLLEHARVHRSEIEGGGDVPVVEPAEVGPIAVHAALHGGTDEKHRAAGAVVGAARRVLRSPAAELAHDEHRRARRHALGFGGVEERLDRIVEHLEVRGVPPALVGVRVVGAEREVAHLGAQPAGEGGHDRLGRVGLRGGRTQLPDRGDGLEHALLPVDDGRTHRRVAAAGAEVDQSLTTKVGLGPAAEQCEVAERSRRHAADSVARDGERHAVRHRQRAHGATRAVVGAVEVTTEPTAGELVDRAAGVPHVGRREVREVGLGVADALHDRDLALGPALMDRRQRRMQAETAADGKHLGLAKSEIGPDALVLRVEIRRHRVEAVVAAAKEDREKESRRRDRSGEGGVLDEATEAEPDRRGHPGAGGGQELSSGDRHASE